MGEDADRAVRSFLAVELPADLRRALAEQAVRVAEVAPELRPTRAERIHVTLRFLGDLQPSALVEVEQSVKARVADLEPFPLALTGIGTFPEGRRPRVLWAGVAGREPLESLAAVVGDATRTVASGDDKPFRAHATIGRFRQPPSGPALERRLREDAGREFGAFEVGEVVLLESRLGAGPAEYRALARLALGGRR